MTSGRLTTFTRHGSIAGEVMNVGSFESCQADNSRKWRLKKSWKAQWGGSGDGFLRMTCSWMERVGFICNDLQRTFVWVDGFCVQLGGQAATDR